MPDWRLTQDDLKQYPHFDKPLSASKAYAVASDAKAVAQHSFFPFIKYRKKWTPFRRRDQVRKKKARDIRYAARCDSYIFSKYRFYLALEYEKILKKENLSDCVIAYRKIPAGGKERGGKNNIHFAREAFEFIAKIGNCCAVSLDINSYFDCIDHVLLKDVWCRLLEVETLPTDHFKVFQAVTKYADVDRDELYERLGFLTRDRRGQTTYTVPKRRMPRQLCSPAEFRAKVVGNKHGPKLVKRNPNNFGIPQGAPISDLLANAYLLEFDKVVDKYARKRGGLYLRYSDDILIVLPGDGRAGVAAQRFASNQIRKFGEKLTIKAEKSSLVRFKRGNDGRLKSQRLNVKSREDGLEYLGFRFDGCGVYLRNATVSSLKRKIRKSAKAEAHSMVARFRTASLDELISRINIRRFSERFGRVEDFDGRSGYKNWTFWSYASKAVHVFGRTAQPIFRQLREQRRDMVHVLKQELASVVSQRR